MATDTTYLLGMASEHVGVRDLDMSAIYEHLAEFWGFEVADTATWTLAESMVDGVGVLMAQDPDEGDIFSEDAAYDGYECVIAQLKHYGLQDDKTLLDMVDDAFLYLSIEAGCREMESIDPTQFPGFE